MKHLSPLFLLMFTLMVNLAALEHDQYQLMDLGLLNYQTSEATCINNQGQICGTYKYWDKGYIYIWDPIQKINYMSMRTSVKPLINNRAEIFGSQWLWTSDGFWEIDRESIFCWKNPLSYFTFFNIKSLGCPKEVSKTSSWLQERIVVWDVNDHGQLVIMNTDAIKDLFPAGPWGYKYKVWIYDNHSYKQINHSQLLVGLRINNQSQVLGCFCEEKTASSKSYNVMTSIYDIKENTTHVLQFPFSSFGKDINDQGQVVGVFYNPLTNMIYGFLGEPSNYLIIDNFNPYAVNNHNQIVGKFLNGDKKDKPAIWKDGQLYDLLNVVDLIDDQGHVWDSLDELVDINDSGEIIGKGKYQGAIHGFLLRPISECKYSSPRL